MTIEWSTSSPARRRRWCRRTSLPTARRPQGNQTHPEPRKAGGLAARLLLFRREEFIVGASYGRGMRSGRRGSAAVAVMSVLSLFAIGAPTQAATAGLRFEDAAGDSLDTRASMDIVAASIEIRPMAPRNTPSLVVSWELSAPP